MSVDYNAVLCIGWELTPDEISQLGDDAYDMYIDNIIWPDSYYPEHKNPIFGVIIESAAEGGLKSIPANLYRLLSVNERAILVEELRHILRNTLGRTEDPQLYLVCRVW